MPRVLFVDDDDVMVMLASLALRRAGHEVLAFSDAGAALAAFRGAPDAVDLAICDMRLGAASGVELCGRLLEARPALPVLLTSGVISKADREAALAAGAREVLPKSKVMTDIPGTVERLLRS